MAKAATIDRFRRGETVMALDDFPGVPQRTKGRVYLVEGFTWIRYRVLFENGVDIGSIDGSSLARPKQFDEALERRQQAAAATEAVVEGPAEEGAPAAGGESASVNGVTVPAHLLERSKRARERLTAG